MEGIVLQLQAEALDDSVDIETLLRKAYLVACKLKLKDFEQWISNEQNGYSGEIPDYRTISGQIRAWNPYRGWMPVVMQGELADVASRMPLKIPIATIADSYKESDGSLMLTVPGAIQDFFNKNTDGFITQYSFHTTKTEMHKIISAVRNKILEWALLLEENGIVGEGLNFTNEEKEVAAKSAVINNYTNNFYANADNTRIEQGSKNGK
ncbi:hypothetical protein SAMN02910451_01883 [Butyrivibrio hungatei]|uniref:AbiTii domain-containing protein n=1 Tax=Butyrivibrio hungatei TaxID=185008 RepID=A0A1G5EAK1_9FIRM|nr:hypothetical protein [Butyrivibrio hungatei]SCY23996.1 hypothetical protein SAMN02910451_01883 [Butyrivibrio hungatei]